jgi:uncharacterized membrane protein
MKLKPIQLFLVAYFILVFVRWVVKTFYTSTFTGLRFVFDGMLLGLVVTCLLYYARIYLTAWIRFKKESKQKSTGA